MTAAEILAALACGRSGCRCRAAARKGSGLAHCPVHDDEDPSLSVNERGGKVLFHCMAGCTQDAVLAELRKRELWPGRFEVRSADGVLVAVHIRKDNSSGKTFKWEGPDGRVGLGGLPIVDLPLYRSQHIQGSPGNPVVIVEGEAAADALAAAVGDRFTVLGSVTGAGSTPSSEVLAEITNRIVTLWPDADGPGALHMDRIGASLLALGCRDLRTVSWPDAPAHGDAVEALNALGVDGVRSLLTCALPFAARGQDGGEPDRTKTLTVVTLADIRPQAIRWLWPGWIARGRLSLLIGHPGEGKSWAALAIAAAVTRGNVFPDTADRREIGQVLFATAEDDLADTIRARFDALDGDAGRLRAVTGIRMNGGDRGLVLPRDVDMMDEELKVHPASLLVIDPLAAFLAGDLDSHRDVPVRAALAPLAKLAADHDVAVLAIVHLTKGARDTPALRAQGSVGFGAAARTVLFLGRDPGDSDSPERHLVVVKSNLGPPPHGLRFTLAGGRFEWLGHSELSGQDLAAPWGDAEERGVLAEAKTMLADLLSSGAKRTREVERACRAAGVSARTIRRARTALGVVPFRLPGLPDDGWWLRLPYSDGQPATDQRTDVPKGANSTEGGQPLSAAPSSAGGKGANRTNVGPVGPLPPDSQVSLVFEP